MYHMIWTISDLIFSRRRASDSVATWVANYKLDENDGHVQIKNDEISNAYVTSEISNVTSRERLV